jgi:hypothetical protein
MAFSARQITLVANTATPLLVLGTGSGSTFVNINSSTIQDPLPVSIKNEDASAVVYIGGPDVSTTNGQSIAAGATFPMNLYGTSEIPYAYSASTPIVSVLVGRQ